jgi:hypothetical protein
MTKSEYDSRKGCMDEIKALTTPEYHEIFRIIKKHGVSYSENSNGIHFDLIHISTETYEDIQKFLVLCRQQRLNEKKRSEEMELLRQETGSSDGMPT